MRLIIPSYLVILFFGVFVIVRATPVNLPRTNKPALTATMTITYNNGQETAQNKELDDKIHERTKKLLEQEIPKDLLDRETWNVYKDIVDYHFVNHYNEELEVIEFRADAVYKKNGETVKKMTFTKAWVTWKSFLGEITGNLGDVW